VADVDLDDRLEPVGALGLESGADPQSFAAVFAQFFNSGGEIRRALP
jgi:hypothetical protein